MVYEKYSTVFAFDPPMQNFIYIYIYIYIYCSHIYSLIVNVCSYYYSINQYIGATVSLRLSKYSVRESDGSITGTVIMSKTASKNVIVGVTISDGTAKGNVYCSC